MAGLVEQLTVLLVIVAGMMFTPLVFIALDFWAGIRKARKRGERIMSNKMKRTMDKVSRYYNAILAMLVVDLIQMSAFVFLYLFFGWKAYTFPVFTMVAVMFVAAVEIKSIYEPADAKENKQIRDAMQLAAEIAKHRADAAEIAEAIASYLQAKEGEK